LAGFVNQFSNLLLKFLDFIQTFLGFF